VAREARDLAARMAAYPGQGLASIKAALRRPVAPGEDIFQTVQAIGQGTAGPARMKG